MKHVAFYNKHQYRTNDAKAVLMNTAEIDPAKGSIYQQADDCWLDENVIVGDADGFDTEIEAIKAANAELDEYWRNRLA
jgi:hypothetical protein